ncbi:hypothetical protein ENBRE01_1660 [Enteropsectra breve]|nr:hypothetical protein ENBRE01_1660 [Enteropsectra breve]
MSKCNVEDIRAHKLNSELVSFASLPYVKEALGSQKEIKKLEDEKIFMGILINGRMALVLMDPQIFDKLSDYLIGKKTFSLGKKEYIQKLIDGTAKRENTKSLKTDMKQVFCPYDKLYHICPILRAMCTIKGKDEYWNIYLRLVKNVEIPKISELRAAYYFAFIFHYPDALLKIEYIISEFRVSTSTQDASLNIFNANLSEKSKNFYHDALISASEAVFRKLYSDYISSPQKQELMTIKLETKTDYKENYLVKMLVRLVLGIGYQPSVYSAPDREFVFRVLMFCSKNTECKLYPDEICGLLKWFNMNNEYFTPEERENSINILKPMLAIPIPAAAIALFQDTLVNNYSPYLGWIYAEYIPCDSLETICSGDLQKKFKDAYSPREFEKFVSECKDKIMQEMIM